MGFDRDDFRVIIDDYRKFLRVSDMDVDWINNRFDEFGPDFFGLADMINLSAFRKSESSSVFADAQRFRASLHNGADGENGENDQQNDSGDFSGVDLLEIKFHIFVLFDL